MGALTLITPPAAEPISIADIKAHLRIDGAFEDPTLLGYAIAARLHLEGAYGWLNRVLITQTWEWSLDQFPYFSSSRIDSISGWDGLNFYGHPNSPTGRLDWLEFHVPLPPLQSVTSIIYIDTNGTPQTMTPTDYDVDTKSEPGRIRPAYGKVWPFARWVPNAVTIRFVAGYGAGPSSIPRPIRLALLGLVGDYYEHRDTDGPTPRWIEALLSSYRVWAA